MKEGNREIHADLIGLCLKGDRNARFQLYHLYAKAMYNICVRMVQNKEDAQDILQDSFIAAFENLGAFSGKVSFGAWMKKIVINRSLNFLRKKKPLFTELENAGDVPDLNEDNDFVLSPEKIHFAIKELPEGARVVLNLYLLEGYKHKEIAEMLDISESTSKSQYRRAIFLLQQKLLENEN
ncbi:MAG: RNA polymerase sigma factor [Bacteroidales bacterium]|nr:RNA polymerase sigma factor [Bacteroidales bacterium]MCF8388121.1 RNA polymerase sigma factor [Bacteroidales bacterium]MCF8398780.1 RNA polymerase sigma factor [Bacteroidales bacterium]